MFEYGYSYYWDAVMLFLWFMRLFQSSQNYFWTFVLVCFIHIGGGKGLITYLMRCGR